MTLTILTRIGTRRAWLTVEADGMTGVREDAPGWFRAAWVWAWGWGW